jgi:hypothetical protein
MLKILIGFVVTAILLIAGVTIFITTQKDESKVAEVIPVVEQTENTKVSETIVKTGNFNYLDPLHFGEGKVEIYDFGNSYKVKLSSDFKSADAPDPYVYLSSSQDFKDRAVAGVDTSRTINLGKLKSFTGEQEYLVSKNDFNSHNAAVVIWCKQFGVQISRADLK